MKAQEPAAGSPVLGAKICYKKTECGVWLLALQKPINRPGDSAPALPAAVTWATHEPRIWSFNLWFHSCTSCCCDVGRTWASYLVIHPVIPLLHFLLLWRGPHMSQFTCFNVHTWEGGHSQYTETRYLMVIIPEVPNVISGTEIIDFFFFFRKWLWGQEYLLQFPWLSLILHIFLTENKSKKEQLQCRTVKQHQRTV